MYNPDSKGIPYGNGLLILVGLWFAGFLVGSAITIPIWLIMTGKSLMKMPTEMLLPENVNALRVIQVVSTLVIFFLPAYFTALIINRKPLKLLGFNTRFNAKQVLLSLVIIFCAALVAGSLAEINEMIPIPKSWATFFKGLEDDYASQVEAISNMKTARDYIISIVMIALLPAVFEETFFRGGMQNLLTRSTKNPWLSIIVTSIIFSIIHLSYYGFLARVCLGIVLGLIYYYSRSIWLNIAAHFFNNAFAVTQLYVLLQKGKSIKDAMNDKWPLWAGLIAIVVLYALFIVFKKLSAQSIQAYTPPEEKALEEKWIA